MEYKDTLNLPRTGFEMKAKLSKREPDMIKKWTENDIYHKILEMRKDQPKFVLHDGPPYANGHIHLGTAMNKILKDMIVKSKSMAGHFTPYVPGWDCHGLPIEHQVDMELGDKRAEFTDLQKRKKCRKYAEKFLDIQREEFKRLMVLGEWDDPYITMDYHYEANIVRELGKFVKTGAVYQGLKPIHWCPTCQTALAEAEVEYGSHTSPSIYVRFPWVADKGEQNEVNKELRKFQEDHGSLYFTIWTTTPWTIPANLAIAVHPEFTYIAAEHGGEVYILAESLANFVMDKVGKTPFKILRKFNGAELVGQECKHPLYDRPSVVLPADYVTLDAGTGCVHTAPGHGQEDYETGIKHGLEVYSPIDDAGCFTKDVEYFTGLNVFKANKVVNAKLEEAGNLLSAEMFTHSYPHCWRSKEPVIFRSTPQWFISMDKTGLREKAVGEIHKVKWDPSWGEERIAGLVGQRPDWCISRQRVWGVPIIAFKCKACNKMLIDGNLIFRVADMMEDHGCDLWFEKEANELLPEGTKCAECGGEDFVNDRNILDVWFDSGVSYACVCEEREQLESPCDLYIEGSDQHRGWFHSSVLCAVGTRGHAPYRSVLTHGYTVDGKGKKLSKSLGNYIPLEKIIEEYGADILRLWTASENFRNDIRVSKEILTGVSQSYRKIRNTLRYMLMNVSDFKPEQGMVENKDLFPIDRWLLHQVEQFKRKSLAAYERYEFHQIYHALNQLCAVTLSAQYFDVVRDRLYCDSADGLPRRSAQTAVYQALQALLPLITPIISFTSEEVYEHMPSSGDKLESVHMLDFPKLEDTMLDEENKERFDRLFEIQAEVNKVLDQSQKQKVIGHPLDALVTIVTDEKNNEFLNSFEPAVVGAEGLAQLFKVSGVQLCDSKPEDVLAELDAEGLSVYFTRAPGEKCERCWTYSTELGTNNDHPNVCPRCARVVAG